MGNQGWPAGEMARVGGRTKYNQFQTARKEQRRALLRPLLSEGMQDVRLLIAWLRDHYPSLPRSEATVRRDLECIRSEWAGRNRCPTCGRGYRHVQSLSPEGIANNEGRVANRNLPEHWQEMFANGEALQVGVAAGSAGESVVVPRRGSGEGMVHADESDRPVANRNKTETARGQTTETQTEVTP